MAKSRLNHRRKNNKAKKSTQQVQQHIHVYNTPIEQQKSKWKKFLKFIEWTGILVGLFIGFFFIKDYIHQKTSTPEQLWKEKNYISGINIPIYIINSEQAIYIKCGNGTTEEVLMQWLKNGTTYSPHGFIFPGGCTPFNLGLRLEGNRLVVSTSFKDIDGHYVGKMDFDHWEAKNNEISDFYNNDNLMELLDNYHHVLFNIQYIYPNLIEINGYFNEDSCIEVANPSIMQGFPKFAKIDYKDEVLKQIIKNKPLGHY